MKTTITKTIGIIASFVLFAINSYSQNFAREDAPDIHPATNEISMSTNCGYATVMVQGNNAIAATNSGGAATLNGGLANKFSFLTPKLNRRDEFWVLGDGKLFLGKVSCNPKLVITLEKSNALFSFGSNGYLEVEGDALYVNDLGIIGVSRDTGVTWTIDTLGMGYAGWFKLDTAQNVWALGEYNGFLYYQNKDTSKWHRVITFSVGVFPQKIYIDRINRFFVSTNNNGVYYSYDQGKTWTQGITGLTSVNCGLMCDDYQGNIYMINTAGSKIYRSVNGGAAWIEPPGDTAVSNHLAATSSPPSLFNSIAGDSILSTSTQFGYYYSKDSGKTWIQDDTGLHEGFINGFWRCKTGRLIETSSNGVFWQDKGNTVWNHPLPTDGYGAAGMLYADTIGKLYVNGLTANSAAPYVMSNDNGTTWQPDTLGNYLVKALPTWWVDQYGNEHNVNNAYSLGVRVYSKTPSNPYVLDTVGIGIFAGFNYPQVLAWGSDGAGYLYMSGSLYDYANVYRRPILGGKWVADTAGTSKTYFNLFTHDASKTMIASPGFHASGLYYRNAGIWTSIPYPTAVPFYGNVSAIACDSSGGLMAAFYHYDFTTNGNLGDGVYCTNDYGLTWTYDGLDSGYVNQLVNCGGDTTYAVTQGAGVYKVVCSGAIFTSTQQNNSVSVHHSVSVYPNPNNGNFTLEMKNEELKMNNGNCSLHLFDVTGRVVLSFKIQNSTSNIQAEGLGNGIYFWQVFSGDKLIDKGKIAVVK